MILIIYNSGYKRRYEEHLTASRRPALHGGWCKANETSVNLDRNFPYSLSDEAAFCTAGHIVDRQTATCRHQWSPRHLQARIR